MDKLVNIAKAISEEKRLRIIMSLINTELCTCQLSELLSLTESTISTHMSILKRNGLVESKKKGRWVYYSLPTEMSLLVKNTLKMVFVELGNSKIVLEDKKSIKEVKVCKTD